MKKQFEQEIIAHIRKEMEAEFLKLLKEIPNMTEPYNDDFFHSDILHFSDGEDLLNKYCPFVSELESNGWEAFMQLHFKDKDGNLFSISGSGYYGGLSIGYCSETYDIDYDENYNYKKYGVI